MISRRTSMQLAAGAGALALAPHLSSAAADGLITRPVPKTGEQLPIVGLGSSATFSRVARSEDVGALSEVMKALVDNGGTVFDTAPSYGASEEVAGRIANELGIQNRIFWATKVNVVPRGGDSADPAAARAQVEESFAKFKVPVIDLIQVHNLADIPVQLGILKELKQAGRVRYIGTTSTNAEQYEYLAEVMRSEPLDFIGIDYAVDNLESEKVILPLAQDRGIAVLGYLPFGRTRLWNRVGDRPVPDWAAEFGAQSWGQFFIKFAASHPAMTVVTPATSQARHMLDNLGAARGGIPDAAMRKRMIDFVDALPEA